MMTIARLSYYNSLLDTKGVMLNIVMMPRSAYFMMTSKKIIKLQEALTVAHHDFDKGLNVRAFFKLGDHELGKDLVQTTFLKTWSYLVKGGKIVLMKAFLYHILNNLIIDEYRKHKASSLDVLLERGFEPEVDEPAVENPNRFLNVLDEKSALLLIARLPEKYIKVMRMRYIQDLSLQEISLITGQSKNAIAVQVHRGLNKLRRLYHRAPSFKF